jgi:pimeloyl-ACP methyl ester carboxylesterase
VTAVIVIACFAGLVIISYVVEALRPVPTRPEQLGWAPDIAVHYVMLGPTRVRDIKVGAGPNLVLLHTLRTQLDIFQRVIPVVADHFTVYACDYPGHGWSDVPAADYSPEDFYGWIATFLESLRIDGACVAGISIGGTIALLLGARRHPLVRRVIAVNPYDYPPAAGVRKSSVAARLILGPARVPILGATLMRLRNRFVSDRIMEGGVASASALPSTLKQELYEVGLRRGHYRAFLNLLRHEDAWARARTEYAHIACPTLLVYSRHDWAPAPVREQNAASVPGVLAETVDGGHFLSLDQPQELAAMIVRFLDPAAASGD